MYKFTLFPHTTHKAHNMGNMVCDTAGGINVMKATGIVRRIDDLGRVVVPKEIRRTLRLREGTPLRSLPTVRERSF